MLEKVKEMKERFCRYLRIREKLGRGYEKENQDYRLKQYGLFIVKAIVKRKEKLKKGMIIEKEEMVLAPLDKNYQFYYEVVNDGKTNLAL